jgi:hypothetical protein
VDTRIRSVGDVLEYCAFEGYAVGEALRGEPGEVDRGVDADGGEGGGGGDAWR